MLLVGPLLAGVVEVEGVGVLHHELAPAQDASARTSLVAVLGLNLVQRQRQVLVGRVQVLDEKREQLLVGRTEQVVAVLAVAQSKYAIAVLGPPAGHLVRFSRDEGREVHLLPTGPVHLLADHPLDVAKDPIAEG